MGSSHNEFHKYLIHPTEYCFEDLKEYRTLEDIKKEEGINGLFFAAVYSPKLFSYDRWVTHAVIIDKDFNIVHDPNPNYKEVKNYPFSKLIRYNGIIDVYLIDKKK